MDISSWLNEKKAEGSDMSQLALPNEMSYDQIPDEVIFFKEVKPCGILCIGNHPFSTVERFGDWYYCRGQDKLAGIHSSEMGWMLFTKDRNKAVNIAKSHIE
jgi:hypothetical protein